MASADPVGGCTGDEFTALVAAFSNNADLATSLCGKLGSANLVDVTEGLNTQFLLFAGALVFIMHGGFAMVSDGGDPASARAIAPPRPRGRPRPTPAPPAALRRRDQVQEHDEHPAPDHPGRLRLRAGVLPGRVSIGAAFHPAAPIAGRCASLRRLAASTSFFGCKRPPPLLHPPEPPVPPPCSRAQLEAHNSRLPAPLPAAATASPTATTPPPAMRRLALSATRCTASRSIRWTRPRSTPRQPSAGDHHGGRMPREPQEARAGCLLDCQAQ
jgi:hypothetical protein